jgi:hypothetical protein
MNPRIRNTLLTASALVTWACSGGAPLPPELENSSDAPSAPATTGASKATEATCDEGSGARCMAPIGYEEGGFVACVVGEKICHAGRWTACSAQRIVAPDPAWTQADVGCAWPPAPCDEEDSFRSCRRQLAPTRHTANCTVVTEVCFGGTWRPCAPGSGVD